MIYSKYIGGAMTERLVDIQQRAAATLALSDEFAVLRDIAGHWLRLYDRTLEDINNSKDTSDAIRKFGMATSNVTSAINEVRDMALAMHRLTDNGKAVDVALVHTMLVQWLEIMHAEAQQRKYGIENPDAFMEAVAEHAKQKMLTVDSMASRTKLTAATLDAEVREMLTSVPRFEEVNGAA